MVRSVLFATVLVMGLFFEEASPKHFRGGYMSYRPTGVPNQITLSFRLAYKHNFFSDPNRKGNENGEDCTLEDKEKGYPIKTGAKLIAIYGPTNIHHTLFDPAYYRCTDIMDGGPLENQWTSGLNESVVTLPKHDSPIWTILYDSCCWVDTLRNYDAPRTWILGMTINLAGRSDLGGRPNSSPYVDGIPLREVTRQCTTMIHIHARDPDGDRVMCRWTRRGPTECDEKCGNPQEEYFDIDEESCVIRIKVPPKNKQFEPGLYVVAVVIEDFIEGSDGPLSKIPYQFLVNIQERDVDCGRVVTLAGDGCYAVPVNDPSPFKIDLHAMTTNPAVPIAYIGTVTKPGTTVSSLIDDGNGHYHVEVSFVPPEHKDGMVEQLCFQAVDEEGLAGSEQCAELYYGGEVPRPVPLISTPSSNSTILVPFLNQEWTIYFTTKIMLNHQMVEFLYDNGTVAHSELLTMSATTTVGTEDPYFVTFTTPDFPMTANTSYTIRLDKGAVVGSSGCHIPSEPAEWRFTTDPGRAVNTVVDISIVSSVHCSPTYMVVYIDRTFLPAINPSILTMNDPDCYGTVYNETHLAIGTMYGKCGTEAVVNEDQTRVSMINNIFLPREGSFVYGNVSTRSDAHKIRFNCSIPTKRIGYVEFNTNHTLETAQINATGESDFALKLFPDESYGRPYRVWDFPIDVQQSARLHFEARTYEPNMAPFLEECVATPTAEPGHESVRYTVIRDGCAIDDTVRFEEAPNTARVRFSIEPFSFIGYNLQNSIFLHCEMRNCNPRNGGCDRDCPDIAKRSVVSSSQMDREDGPVERGRGYGNSGAQKEAGEIYLHEI